MYIICSKSFRPSFQNTLYISLSPRCSERQVSWQKRNPLYTRRNRRNISSTSISLSRLIDKAWLLIVKRTNVHDKFIKIYLVRIIDWQRWTFDWTNFELKYRINTETCCQTNVISGKRKEKEEIDCYRTIFQSNNLADETNRCTPL